MPAGARDEPIIRVSSNPGNSAIVNMRGPLVLGSLVFLVTACSAVPRFSPYRVDIHQGNLVTQEMAAQLKPGMTKDQVRFVLGTPLVTDVFHADRWDYVYRYHPGRGEPQQRALTVFFEDGRLARVAGDVVAAPEGEGERQAVSGRRVVEIGEPKAGQ